VPRALAGGTACQGDLDIAPAERTGHASGIDHAGAKQFHLACGMVEDFGSEQRASDILP
jgi:hypothetical protein